MRNDIKIFENEMANTGEEVEAEVETVHQMMEPSDPAV